MANTPTKAELRASVQANNPLDGVAPNIDAAPVEFMAHNTEQRNHISESGRAPKIDDADRVTIILDDNDEIPPGGQFVGVNGVGYQLLPGVEARVPRAICEVLDRAIKSIPVQDKRTQQIIGWKERKRFPYTVVRDSAA